MLNRYGSNRPPWKVAGTDYVVGINNSAVPLKDASSASLPANVTRSGTDWNLTGNATVDGYDFSVNNGMRIVTNGFDLTVRNCYFKQGSNQLPAMSSGGGSDSNNIDVRYCAFDSNSPTFWSGLSTTGFLALNANTAFTLMYCYFINGNGEHVVTGGAGVSNAVFTIKYNVFGPSGYGEVPSGGSIHGDIIQTFGGGSGLISNFICDFNVIFTDDNNSSRLWSAQGFSLNSANTTCCPTTALSVSYNTVWGTANSYSANNGASNAQIQGCPVINRSWYNNTITYNRNYIDSTQVNGSPNGKAGWRIDYYPETTNGTGTPTFSITSNIDMSDGTTLT